jgi:hypothetical protein
MSTIVAVWAGVCLAVVVGVALAARRIGRARAAAWLVALGLVVLALEEPAITLWLAIAGPGADPDRMSGLITPMARAHVLDAGLFGVASAALLGGVALTAFKRGERWARRLLLWGLVVVTAVETASSLLVFSRGLPLPGPGGTAGRAGFGWQPVAVGLLAWTTGLWLVRRTHPTGSASGTAPASGAAPADIVAGTGV